MDDLFSDSAHKLFTQTFNDAVRHAAESGRPDANAWRACEESGFLDALVPEPSGGAGLRLCDVLPVALSAGWHAIPAPIVPTMLARAWLATIDRRAADGSIAIAPFGLERDQDALRIPCVAWGRVADWVLARSEHGWHLLDARLAQRTPWGGHGSLDAGLLWQGTLPGALPACEVEPDTLAAASHAAMMAGAMERVLGQTQEYANQRAQFGRPIGKFQAVQQQLSVMAEHVAAARMAAVLAFQSETALPDPVLAMAGKARAAMAAPLVADIAHAVHGAIGITEEYALQRFTRRLREWRRADGSESYWAERIGAHALSSGATALAYLRTRLYAVAA